MAVEFNKSRFSLSHIFSVSVYNYGTSLEVFQLVDKLLSIA